VEVTKIAATAPEYQYTLKDHLGNVRVTFTSKDETEANTATLEPTNATTEQGKFLRYTTAKMVNSSMFDRTNGSAPSQTLGYAQRLNGSANEKYGLARSISVMPGDVINAEVYAKYVDPVTSNWNAALTTLVNQVAAGTAGVVVDGANYTNSTSSFPTTYPGLQSKTDNGAPKAYLNWLVFDRNFVFLNGGFKQITTAGKEAGTDVAHERVFNTNPIVVAEPGYVYIYVSNENTTLVDVYFDDFKVTQTKSPVIASNDYYPFGLTFNSYNRENSTQQNYLYNGKEVQDELNLDWLDYGWRMYDPTIGRWGVIDKHSETYYPVSPYNYCINNPINLIDYLGMDPVYRNGKYYETGEDGKEREVDWDYVQNWLQNNNGIAATYSFKSKPKGNAEITKTDKKGNDNSFFFNGDKFIANSYATLMGRDDKDNSVGAFSTIEELSDNNLITVLGYGAYVIHDIYNSNVEGAMLGESIGGRLDFKNKVYDLLGIDRNALLKINGVVYNANEAGNYLWGMVLEYHGGLISPNTVAEAGSQILSWRRDEAWEQKAVSAGRRFGESLTTKGTEFKKSVLQVRINARLDGY
jgi:RHS repeat-associated protein